MKKILLILVTAIVVSCQENEKNDIKHPPFDSEIKTIANGVLWSVYELKCDSNTYIIAKGIECISIIKK